METSLNKQFSVIIKFDEFDSLSGELATLNNESDSGKIVKQFFLKKYGGGAGKLEIIPKKSKAKLNWVPPKQDPRAEGFHKVALLQAKNKNYVEAVNNWIKAISLNSTDPDYSFNLGIAFFEIKNYKESIENLKSAINLCPIYYRAYLILGTVYLKLRQFEHAELYLKESINFCPNHSLAYLNLGAVYSILKRYDEGIKMFLKTLELSPNEMRAHFGIGKIYSIKGEVEKANHYFKKVIEIDSTGQLANHAKRAMISIPIKSDVQFSGEIDSMNFENLYQEGYRAFLYTDYEKSIQMYSAYLNYKPQDDFVWFSLGESFLRNGEISKAAEAFQKAINVNSNKALYYKELAIVYDYLDKGKDAFDCLNRVHKLGKFDSLTYSLLGKHLIQQQKYDDAISHLEKAVKLNSNNLLAKYYLAIAHDKNKDKNSAISYLKEVIATPIKSPLKMKSEAILNNYR